MNKNMTLKRLIKHLENIYTQYGDMPVEGNIINGDNCWVSALCVDRTDEEPTLFIEVEISEDIPLFTVYEYPSNQPVRIAGEDLVSPLVRGCGYCKDNGNCKYQKEEQQKREQDLDTCNIPPVENLTTKEEIENALDMCEHTCKKYYSCDTVAVLNDQLKELEEKEDIPEQLFIDDITQNYIVTVTDNTTGTTMEEVHTPQLGKAYVIFNHYTDKGCTVVLTEQTKITFNTNATRTVKNVLYYKRVG